MEGADAAELTKRVEKWKLAAAPASAAPEAVPAAIRELKTRLEALINAAPVMLFMKGSPESPKCKFSRRMVELLQEGGATFGSFDILTSDAVRQGLKEHSNWPTYPQLYVEGKLVGGVDIVQELRDSGELAGMLPKASPPASRSAAAAAAPASSSASSNSSSSGSSSSDSSKSGPALSPDGTLRPEVEARLRALMTSAPAVLFMKGSPSAPQCGFSDKMVALLKAQGVRFASVDILADPQAREGLKVLNSWPTFPQLIVNGALVGGLDVVREMAEDTSSGSLAEQLGLPREQPLEERLKALTSSARVMLFMKGSHTTGAKCGFSDKALSLIEENGLDVASASSMAGPDGKPLFGSFDILSDHEVRQGLKAFSNWPTYPQLYVEGKLVGGVDIMRELAEEGELRGMLLGE